MSDVIAMSGATDSETRKVYYTLNIPVDEELNSGVYRCEIELYPTTTVSTRPLKFIIENFTVEVQEHEHYFTERYVEKTPTETESGSKVCTCKQCNIKEYEEIDELGYKNTTFNVKDTVTMNVIENAKLYISGKEGAFCETIETDDRGNAFIALEKGVYNVQSIPGRYQIRNFTVEKKDEISAFTVYMNKNDIINVNTTVREMSRNEIIEVVIEDGIVQIGTAAFAKCNSPFL